MEYKFGAASGDLDSDRGDIIGWDESSDSGVDHVSEDDLDLSTDGDGSSNIDLGGTITESSMETDPGDDLGPDLNNGGTAEDASIPKNNDTGIQDETGEDLNDHVESAIDIVGNTDETMDLAAPEINDGGDYDDSFVDALDEKPPCDDHSDMPKVEDIQEWLGDINPNHDPFDLDSPYSNNCGSCALAVEQKLNGDMGATATAENIGTPSEMSQITGMEQVPMDPEEIKNYLISQGPGSHGIVGIDRTEGPGHWFNAYYDGEKVMAIDGQTGEIHDWPPDYGDVTNWDLSVREGKA